MSEPSCADPVFIVGPPRSGTTLLTTLLNRHSRIAASPETHFVRYWMRRFPGDPSSDEHFERFWRAFVKSERWERFELDADATRARIDRVRPRSWRSVFDGLMNAYAEAQGKPRWAEKTPDHFQFLPTLFRWYSEACVLFLVRDPRAVAYSTANSPWANKNIPGHAFKWRRSIDILDGLSGDGRVLRVRYEDLARNPEVTLRGVCDHIGEEFESRMLVSGERAAPGSAAGSRGGAWFAEHFRQASGVINTENIDKWRRQMTRRQIRAVEAVAGAKLTEQGYELSEHAPGPIGRLVVLGPFGVRRMVSRCLQLLRGVASLRGRGRQS